MSETEASYYTEDRNPRAYAPVKNVNVVRKRQHFEDMHKRVETLQSLGRWDRFRIERAAAIDNFIMAKKK
jgi:hypothetical protein